MDIGIFVFQTGSSMDPALLAKPAEELGFESFTRLQYCRQVASPY